MSDEEMTPLEALATASPTLRAYAEREGLTIVGFRTTLGVTHTTLDRLRAAPAAFATWGAGLPKQP